MSDRRKRRWRTRGQAMAEFAVILPLMLALLGAAIDFARLFQVRIALEGATRDAAEYVATNGSGTGTASAAAAARLNAQLSGFGTFAAVASTATCPSPGVVATYSTSTAFSAGGSTSHPVATVRVDSCYPFSTLFPYPFVPSDGPLIIGATSTMSIIQGR
jgi:Flp pilus assembly protein TadG